MDSLKTLIYFEKKKKKLKRNGSKNVSKFWKFRNNKLNVNANNENNSILDNYEDHVIAHDSNSSFNLNFGPIDLFSSKNNSNIYKQFNEKIKFDDGKILKNDSKNEIILMKGDEGYSKGLCFRFPFRNNSQKENQFEIENDCILSGEFTSHLENNLFSNYKNSNIISHEYSDEIRINEISSKVIEDKKLFSFKGKVVEEESQLQSHEYHPKSESDIYNFEDRKRKAEDCRINILESPIRKRKFICSTITPPSTQEPNRIRFWSDGKEVTDAIYRLYTI